MSETYTYRTTEVALALEVAAEEVEAAYRNGLHEHGIPVPAILLALRDSILFMKSTITLPVGSHEPRKPDPKSGPEL